MVTSAAFCSQKSSEKSDIPCSLQPPTGHPHPNRSGVRGCRKLPCSLSTLQPGASSVRTAINHKFIISCHKTKKTFHCQGNIGWNRYLYNLCPIKSASTPFPTKWLLDVCFGVCTWVQYTFSTLSSHTALTFLQVTAERGLGSNYPSTPHGHFLQYGCMVNNNNKTNIIDSCIKIYYFIINTLDKYIGFRCIASKKKTHTQFDLIQNKNNEQRPIFSKGKEKFVNEEKGDI